MFMLVVVSWNNQYLVIGKNLYVQEGSSFILIPRGVMRCHSIIICQCIN